MDGPAGSQKASFAVIRGKAQGCFFGAFFRTHSFPIFLDVGSIWDPKRRPKSSLGLFVFGAFFERVLASIFGRFWEAPNPENMHGA